MSVKNIWNDVPQTVHNKVLETLDSLENSKFKYSKKSTFYKIAVTCMIVVCVSGITVYAAEAIHSYKQRMLEMNKHQLEEYYAAVLPSETICYSRPLTDEEEARFNVLKEAYISEGIFPEGELQYLNSASDYDGKGVALEIATGTLYLPDTLLTDEELLQMIDFFQKSTFSVYALNQEWLYADYPWHERMEAMTDEEIDEAYITMFTGEVHVAGALSRKLSDEEHTRYEKLKQLYENENRIPADEIVIVATPEEYIGETVTFCIKNSTYYLPNRTLTDEEFLQIIELNHKADYSIDKIAYEINMGLRTHYPGYPKE